MVLKKTIILSIKITQSTKKDIIDYVLDYLQKKSGQPLTIFTPNPEQIVQARENPEFARVLNSADINLPDGKRLVWASKQLSAKVDQLSQKISGIDLMEDLIKSVAARGYQIGFLGGRNGVAQAALEYLQKKYPRLRGWAQDGPEMTISNFKFQISNNTNQKNFHEGLVEKIKASGVKLLFIGLGAPKQEFFIEAISHQLSAVRQSEDGKPSTRAQAECVKSKSSPIILMSVGGAFDIISGKLPRAPQALRNLEFIWRLILEPGRFVRQLRLLRFIFLVFRAKYGKM